ncbi:MAG: diguanylate cyclase [Pseudomonadota bacterium]|nr:diguanylate cyclase [Pseudomonadota bacterium]
MLNFLPQISELQPTVKLGESFHAEVYQARRFGRQRDECVVKFIRPNFVVPDLQDAIRRQLSRWERLHPNQVVLPTDLLFSQGRFALVMPDGQGVPLQEWLCQDDSLAVEVALGITMQLASILSQLASQGLVHGAVKPSNILLSPESMEVRLTDVIRIVPMDRQSIFSAHPHFLRHTLPYLAPEQTGRISQSVSPATDLYGLGVVLHELLTGSPPFEGSEPASLVHSVLARQPDPVHWKRPDVPEPVSMVVARLLAKEPNQRYSSAASLLKDLARARAELLSDGVVSAFALDVDWVPDSDVPEIPVFGREEEIKTLTQTYDAVAKGAVRVVLISGVAGIGKSRLVDQLQVPIVLHHGYFMTTRLDGSRNARPYEMWVGALDKLLQVFLTEDDEQVETWSRRVKEGVRNEGRALADLLPHLEHLVGTQPELPELSPLEAKQRTFRVLTRLLSVIASSKKPLVLFFDDMQWADKESLEFWGYLSGRTGELSGLMLIGAYRRGEMSEKPALQKLLRTLALAETSPVALQLAGLDESACRALIMALTEPLISGREALCQLVLERSRGNPLFVIELLRWLRSENLLTSDARGWRFDALAYSQADVPAEDLGLVRGRINALDGRSEEMLAAAAAIGRRFKLSELSLATGRDLAEIEFALEPAKQENLIQVNGVNWIFVHDRIQKAAMERVGAEKCATLRYRLGEHYATLIDGKAGLREDRGLFRAADYLNAGRPACLSGEKRLRDIRINLMAGQHAYRQKAIESAGRYFAAAHELFTPEIAHQDAELVKEVTLRHAVVESLLGNDVEAEVLLDRLLSRDDASPAWRATVLHEKGVTLSNRNEFQAAIPAFLEALSLLGYSVEPKGRDVRRATVELLSELNAMLLDIQPGHRSVPRRSQDPRRELILNVCRELAPCYYLTGSLDHYFYVGTLATHLQAKIDSDSRAWRHYFLVGVCSVGAREFKQHALADLLEDIQLRLCRERPGTLESAFSFSQFVGLGFHWRHTMEEARRAASTSLAVGEELRHRLVVCNCQVLSLFAEAFSATNLTELHSAARSAEAYAESYELLWAKEMAASVRIGFVNPLVSEADPNEEQNAVNHWMETQQWGSLATYYGFRATSAYFFGDVAATAELLKRAEPGLSIARSILPERQWHIVRVLHALDEISSSPDGPGSISESPVGQSLELIRGWAGLGPALRPYLALIEARLAELRQDDISARNLYLDSIDLAEEAKYNLLLGHVHERFGHFLRDRQKSQATYHLQAAARVYRELGADKLVAQLSERDRIRTVDEHDQASDRSFDTALLLDIAHRISNTPNPHELFRIIIEVVLDRLSALDCYLIASRDGALFLRAVGRKNKRVDVELMERPLADVEDLFGRSIIRHAQRTRQSVQLEDASRTGLFTDDPEVQKLSLRSVLCYPLISRGKVLGLLYLQNNLLSGVFSESDLEFVDVVASQVAGALESARLYRAQTGAMEELYREKERAQVTLASIADGVITLDRNNRVEYMNSSAEALTGWELRDARGHPVAEVLRLTGHQSSAATGSHPFEFNNDIGGDGGAFGKNQLLSRDGRELTIQASTSAIRGQDGNAFGAVVVFRDITDAERMAEEIAYYASHDALTGLVNRREFERRCQSCLDSAKSEEAHHCLLYLDLDRFKQVNDTCGHGAGDQLLKQVSESLKGQLRRTDSLARLGGDEFAALLAHCDVKRGLIIAENIRRTVEDFEFVWDGQLLQIGVSIGVVPIVGDKMNLSRLLSLADSACYEAKKLGRNRIHQLHSTVSEKEGAADDPEVVAKVGEAISAEGLELFAQRIVPLDGAQEINWCKTFLQWGATDGEDTSSQRLRSVFAANGPSAGFDGWVVRKSLDWLASMPKEKRTVALCSVDLSAASLNDAAFRTHLYQTISESSVDPARLCFEISEVDAISCELAFKALVQLLRPLGCRFAIDGFGAQIGSINRLRDFAVNFVKIDVGSSEDLAKDAVHKAYVSAVRVLTAASGIQLVATHVSDEVSLETWRALGVDYAQGSVVDEPHTLSSLRWAAA